MISFSPPRNRDAYAVVRGFVYQVDLTLERWINLHEGEILELERGEDIDTVLQSLTSSQEVREQERLLEQVKHLQKPITLHTPDIISAIANFVEQRQANTHLNLRFRFTTTANVGRERPTRLPKKIAGIMAWEQVRTSPSNSVYVLKTSDLLRKMLQHATRPSNLPIVTWAGFQSYLANATAQEWLDFVKQYEWSTGYLAEIEMAPHIQKLLQQTQFAADEHQAVIKYQRLFLHVFKVLSLPGIKRLTVEDRNLQLSLPVLNTSDNDLLVKVIAGVCTLEARVAIVEQDISHMRAQVEQITLGQSSRMGALTDDPPLITDMPPTVVLFSQRTNTVLRLLPEILRCTCTMLCAGAGQGKTHLAILLVQEHGDCLAWLRFRDLTSEQAIRRLSIMCEARVGNQGSSGSYDWYCQMFAQAPRGSILVLDDLPRFSSDDKLVEILTLLTKAAERYDVHILATSGYQITPALNSLLTDRQFQTIDCPKFTDDEAIDIFRLHNAPLQMRTQQFGAFVNNLARQHPLLLNAAVKYLVQRNWRLDDDVFDGLLRGTYAIEIGNDTVHRLIRSIEDEQSRELLYRLNLFLGHFALDDVMAIATVTPSVSRPRERLDTITDLWVQSDNQQEFLVSPLVKSLGINDLTPDTRRAGHLLIADRAISKGQLSQYDAVDVLTHLFEAESYDRAAEILVGALIKLARSEPDIPDAGLLSFWYSTSLPTTISLGLRISLRGVQASARHHFNKPFVDILDELEAAIHEASELEAWAVMIAAVNACHVLVESNLQLANALLLRALQLLPNGKMLDGTSIVLESDIEIETLIWDHVRGISTSVHLLNWMETLAAFTTEQRVRTFSSEYAMTGCLQVINRFWLLEANKPQEEQKWQIVLDTLRKIESQASQLNLEVLWASTVRAKIVVLAEYMHDLESALAEATAALLQAPPDPRVQFLIRECVGRQYTYNQRFSEARAWLDESLNYDIDAFPIVTLYALLTAGIANGELNAALALTYNRRAVQLAENQVSFPDSELVKTLGELAVSEWLAGDLLATFSAWDKAAEALLACRAEDDTWKSLFTLFGHVSGYLTQVANTGKGIKHTRSGEQYREPFRGIFIQTNNPAAAKLYDPRLDCFLFAQLAHFAEAVGNDNRAGLWASRGIDAARLSRRPLVISDLGFSILPALIIAGRYGDALEVGLEAGAIQTALGKKRKQGIDVTDIDVEIDILLMKLNEDERNQGEYGAAIGALLPIAFHLHRNFTNQATQFHVEITEIVGLCTQIAETASDRTLWSTAAHIFEQTFLSEATGSELIKLGNQTNVENYTALKIICYLGAIIKKDVGIEEAALGQLAVMPIVQRLLPFRHAAYRGIVLPYLAEFWLVRLQRARGLFGSPKLFEEALTQAVISPEEFRAQRILSAVVTSLRFRPSREAEEWLSG